MSLVAVGGSDYVNLKHLSRIQYNRQAITARFFTLDGSYFDLTLRPQELQTLVNRLNQEAARDPD